MKLAAAALVSIILSIATVLAGAAIQDGAWPSGADAIGLALAIAVAGVILVSALYWPVLAYLRRRFGRLSVARAAIVAAAALNAPVYVALAVVGQNPTLFAGGEAFLIGLAVAVLGVAFGVGYARMHVAGS